MEIYFRLLVYTFAGYFIIKKKSKKTNTIGWIIIISHLYKDLTKLNQWPLWSEYIGSLIGLVLTYEGFKINDLIVLSVGLFKSKAHIGKLLLNTKYYY